MMILDNTVFLFSYVEKLCQIVRKIRTHKKIWCPCPVFMIHALSVVMTVMRKVFQVTIMQVLLLLAPLGQLPTPQMMNHLTLRKKPRPLTPRVSGAPLSQDEPPHLARIYLDDISSDED
jgi:hypothetical protein